MRDVANKKLLHGAVLVFLMLTQTGLCRLPGGGGCGRRAAWFSARNALGGRSCGHLQQLPGAGAAMDILFPLAVEPGLVSVVL